MRVAAMLLAVTALATPAHAADLVLKRVTLSSAGVGYFEYEAAVDGPATLGLDVPLDQVDDVLKSLVVFDDAGGVGGIDLPGRDDVHAALGDVPFGRDGLASPLAFLNSLQGVEVSVAGPRPMTGRILHAEAVQDTPAQPNAPAPARTRVSVLTADGLKQFVLEDSEAVQVTDPALRERIARALAAIHHETPQYQATSGTRPRATLGTHPPPLLCRSGGCRCRCGPEQPRATLLAQPVAIAANGQHVAVVQQAVQDGGRHDLVAQHRAPVAHGAIGGEQDAAALVAAADQLEQQVRRRGFERQIAELVDDQQPGLGQLRQTLFQPPLRMPPDQGRHQGRRRGEQHRVAVPDRLAPKSDGEVISYGLPSGFGRLRRCSLRGTFVWRCGSLREL